MKVLLVAVNSKFIHSNLAIRYLKAYTKDLNYECTLKEFTINDRKEHILEKIMREKPNVVCFSCYIWNIEYVQSISKLVKLVDKNIEILYGGPEVTYDAKTFLRENVGDYVIEGEGEETFREFIICKLQNGNTGNIKGLYTKKLDSILFGGKRENMLMHKIVFPYSKEDDLKHKIVYYEGSRGCPFKCKYCLSSTLHGVRIHEIQRVKEELKFLVDKEVKLIKFVDRTFNCDHNFAKEIWKYIIELDTDATFHFEISADLLREDEIQILSKAPKDRIQFEVGVQTTNNEVLRNINRFVNFESIKQKVEELKKLSNIKQHLDLIAGLPGEDLKSFIKSFNDVYSIEPEEIQLGFLKLLKGSPMRAEKEKWGMIHSPYTPYEILKTKCISYEEILILKKVEEVLDKYYNSQKFNNILAYYLPKFKTPFEFYYELGMFVDKKGYLDRNISSAKYYKIFIEFNEEYLKESSEILKEIIKYDYLKFNKKQWLPDFLKRDISKKEKNEVKYYILNNNIKVSSNIHIEKFFINIEQYFDTGIILNETCYCIFDEKDKNIIVLTNDKLLTNY